MNFAEQYIGFGKERRRKREGGGETKRTRTTVSEENCQFLDCVYTRTHETKEIYMSGVVLDKNSSTCVRIRIETYIVGKNRRQKSFYSRRSCVAIPTSIR